LEAFLLLGYEHSYTRFFGALFSFLWGVYPGVRLLGFAVTLVTIRGTAQVLFVAVIPLCIPTRNVGSPGFSAVRQHLLFSAFSLVILVVVMDLRFPEGQGRWPSWCLLAIFVSLEKCLLCSYNFLRVFFF
jgi:hypothetical protein